MYIFDHFPQIISFLPIKADRHYDEALSERILQN